MTESTTDDESGKETVGTYREENSFGVPKTRLQVQIGTTVLDVPKKVKNPTTGKTQDLTQLSEDGYCLKFLAAWSHFNSQNTVNLSDDPVLTLDRDKWEFAEIEGTVVAKPSDSGGDDAE